VCQFTDVRFVGLEHVAADRAGVLLTTAPLVNHLSSSTPKEAKVILSTCMCSRTPRQALIPPQLSARALMAELLRCEGDGDLDASLHELITADEDFISLVEVLACPVNEAAALDASTANQTPPSTAKLFAPKQASYQQHGQAYQPYDCSFAANPQSPRSVPQTRVATIDSSKLVHTAAHPQPELHELAIESREEKIRESNRRKQKAYRERLSVRCLLLQKKGAYVTTQCGNSMHWNCERHEFLKVMQVAAHQSPHAILMDSKQFCVLAGSSHLYQ
jgi:hypothetical protein